MTSSRITTRRGVIGLATAATLSVAASSGVLANAQDAAAPVVTDDGQIDALLGGMSLAEKVARLFTVPVAGTALTAEEEGWLREVRPGGVLLLGSNVGPPDETAGLIAAILATNPALPPMVAVDQEGGLVARLPGDTAPSAPELGLLPPAEIAAFARARAEFLAGWGVSVNFAPVADVAGDAAAFMAGRAFGSDPALVAEAVAAYVEGARGGGVVHAAKHFPGHGRGTTDSHLALPTVAIDREEWRRTDALPFAAAVDAGVEMVMLGHLLYPAWDDLPASLSPVAVGSLRDDLGFAGVVVTDDLGMDALAAYGALETIDLAVAAGVDLLLYARPPLPLVDLVAHLVDWVESGDLPEARIDESARRVLALKFGR